MFPVTFVAGAAQQHVSPQDAMTMRLAVRYFERLISDTEPIEAVAFLADAWRGRADDKLPRFGLSEPEYFVQLCLIYIGEVGNGCHGQFFMNRGGRYIGDTLQALATVGLHELNEILKSAVELFPGKQVPKDSDAAERVYAEFSDRQMAMLAELDKRCFDLYSDCDRRLLSYLRKHRDEILLPERGLPNSGHAG